MKLITLLAGVFLITSLQAQSKKGGHPMTKEVFQVTLKVGEKGKVSVVRFASGKGKKMDVRLTNFGDLPIKKLGPGTIIKGSFRFSTFSSDGGLGGTRIVSGEGKGDMLVAKIILDDGADLYSSLAGVGDMVFRIK